jgi:hypothetical protein
MFLDLSLEVYHLALAFTCFVFCARSDVVRFLSRGQKDLLGPGLSVRAGTLCRYLRSAQIDLPFGANEEEGDNAAQHRSSHKP